MPISSVSDRARAAKLLRTHALTSEDYFKLWPADKAYFWSASRDAFIAYRVVDSIAFALAEPVATSDAERQQILQDFQAYCRSQEWYLCFLLVGEGTKRRYEALGLKTVKMGASAMVSLKTFTTQTANDKWWRWHRNNGNKLGYVYEFHTPPHAKSLLVDMRQVSNAWLVDGQRREQGFALGYFDEAYLQKCTLHVLRNKYGNVIAFVNEVPRFNHLSGATLDLMRFLPDTPHAMPYLFLNMLQTLQEVGHLTYFDLGFVPLARMQGRLPAIARLIGARRFSAAGLEQFKNKVDPDWQPNYLAYDGDLKDLAYIALNLERVVSIDPTVPAG